MACGSKNPSMACVVVVIVVSLTPKGYGWNQPGSYYQGDGVGGGNGGGFFGGRSESALNNQGLAGPNAGFWSGSGVGSAFKGGNGFSGQGQSGGVDRAPGFGGSSWPAGDRRALDGRVSPGGVSTTGDNLGPAGTGLQQGGTGAGAVGGSGYGAPSATGSGNGLGYNGQGNAGGFGGPNFGQRQTTPGNANGGAPGTNGFGGSFGPPSSGFGPSGHGGHGHRYPSTYAGGPPSPPWQYSPAPGGYGASRWPWNGAGYVYRVPVAHINPDGSYSFSYYTPHSSREENGHSNGNVEGTYGFQNDGAKHNFSFNAAPDVDLRTNFDGSRPNGLNPDEYGPQSVHSRARLPLIPGASSNGAVDEQTRTPDGLPVSVDRSQGPSSWPRSGADGARSNGGQNSNAGNDDNSLAVVGLPKASTAANDASQPTAARDQVVRGSTEPGVSSYGASELDGRTGSVGTPTTARPLGGSIEEVMARPVSGASASANEIDRNGGQYNGGVPVDRSYQFGYQTPDATRQESADPAGNVRGSFAYNNEAGRNDLQYVAGAGMGFRPTGGSLSVPNGVPGAGSTSGGPTGSRATGGDLSNGQRFGNGGVFGGDGSSLGSGGLAGTFGGSNAGFEVDRSSLGAGSQTAGSSAGFGSDGRPFNFGNQGTQFGGEAGRESTGNGLRSVGRPLGAGTQFGVGSGSGTGFDADGRPFGSQPGGGFGTESGAGNGRPFGSQGTQASPGTGSGFAANGRPFALGQGGQGGQAGDGTGSGFGSGDGRSVGFGNTGTQAGAGSGSGGDGSRFGFGNQGTQFGAGGTQGSFGGSGGRSQDGGRSVGFGNPGTQAGAGSGSGDDGNRFGFGNQGTQFGAGGTQGSFGGSGGRSQDGGRSVGFGNPGTQAGAGSGSGDDGNRFGFGNQGTQFGAGGTQGSFGGSGGRSFGVGNQGGQGFSTGGNQATTRNPVTRSPSADAFIGSSPRGLTPADEDVEQESTTFNEDDSEQTTTFGGYGDVSGNGLATNANRLFAQ